MPVSDRSFSQSQWASLPSWVGSGPPNAPQVTTQSSPARSQSWTTQPCVPHVTKQLAPAQSTSQASAPSQPTSQTSAPSQSTLTDSDVPSTSHSGLSPQVTVQSRLLSQLVSHA